jgi:hypothetical protein
VTARGGELTAPGAPVFQAATAHFNPWTEAKANGSCKKQERDADVTEITETSNHGHALTVDNGWKELADAALTLVRRFV